MGKYIIFKKDKKDSCEYSMLFEPILGHDEVFNMVSKHFKEAEVISAGFWETNAEGNIICFGKSHSLNISCREQDSILLSARCLRNI